MPVMMLFYIAGALIEAGSIYLFAYKNIIKLIRTNLQDR